MIGDSEARKMTKCWFQNANKGTNDQADPLVKKAWNWVIDTWT
jgi:hypothetical protein